MAMAVTNTRGTTDRRTVVGVFDGTDRAERALNDLKAAGFAPEQVSVVAKDRGAATQVTERADMAAEGAAAGAVTGGVLGGIAGFLVGISALVIPGIGPIVGGGILLATLAGAGVGAAAGGLVGALVEAGVPEEDARAYETHVGQGRILLTVHATTDAQAREAHAIFARHDGTDVRAYGVLDDTGRRRPGDRNVADDRDMTDEAGAALGGAAGVVAGGAIGTAVGGPIGTAAGAVIGGVAGAGAGHAAGEAAEDDRRTATGAGAWQGEDVATRRTTTTSDPGLGGAPGASKMSTGESTMGERTGIGRQRTLDDVEHPR